MTSKLEDLTTELTQLQAITQNNNEDKDHLKSTIQQLKESVQEYKSDEEIAAQNAEDLKSEVVDEDYWHQQQDSLLVNLVDI